jgi:iron(III) transport system substrate-binding protein
MSLGRPVRVQAGPSPAALLLSLGLAALLGLGACTPAASPAPTSPPAKPTEAPKPAEAKPAASPAAAPAPAAPAASPAAAAPAKPAASPAAAKPAEAKPAAKPTTFEELARYLGPDRQQILLEGALKEGTLLFYTSGILTAATGDVIKNFEAKYPGIKVEVVRASDDELAARTIREYGANQFLVDVFEMSSDGLLPMKTRNVLGSFNSPELSAFIDESKTEGPNGVSWVVVRESYHGIGWNTTLVNEADVPKTHDDLLEPRWKGVFAVHNAFDNTIGAYIQAKGRGFIDRLAEQKIRYMQVSARQLADLVIAGEIPISPALASAHVTDSKAKGAPLAWRPLEPTPTNDGSVAIAAKPPHPHAALLYLDFAISKEGQKSYDTFGYGIARKDMESHYSLSIQPESRTSSRVSKSGRSLFSI